MIFERVEDYILDLESGDLHGSPEDFLIQLEEQLDSGEISLLDAIQLLEDLSNETVNHCIRSRTRNQR